MQAQYLDKRNVLNKSYLIETIVRNRIKDSLFYKQYLYLTNEQTILPVIVDQVHYVGGSDSSNRPSPFLCCLLRMLEINVSLAIIKAYLARPEFKYLTCLALFYCRLTQKLVEVYTLLDSYNANYSKLRMKLTTPVMRDGIPVNFTLTYMDEFVDNLLQERCLGLILPILDARLVLVDKGEIKEREFLVKSSELDQINGSSSESLHDSASDDSFVSDSD